MTEQQPLVTPTLVRSSAALGWQGLLVQVYAEPDELEEWIDPPSRDTRLVVATRGVMTMQQPGTGWSASRVAPGDLFLRPAGSTASPVSWQRCSPDALQTLHVHLEQALLTHVAHEVLEADPDRLMVARRAVFQDALLMQLSLALGRELEQPTTASRVYAETAAHMLAVHLLRHYAGLCCSLPALTSGLTRRQLQRLTEFVQAHLSDDLSLASLAAHTGFSPYHFARLFCTTTGQSPHQWLLRQRIAQAQRLLATTDMPLAHVASTCGFANQSHLTRAFSQQLGLTPRIYRQQHQTAHVCTKKRTNQQHIA